MAMPPLVGYAIRSSSLLGVHCNMLRRSSAPDCRYIYTPVTVERQRLLWTFSDNLIIENRDSP